MTKKAMPVTPAPDGATRELVSRPAYVIKVPTSDKPLEEREERQYYEFGFRELDEVTYKAVRQFFGAGAELEAVRLFVMNLWCAGEAKERIKEFRIAQAMVYTVLEIIEPWSSDLKKN